MHIVATTDFSPESRRVFPILRRWMDRLDARVTVLHVVPDLQILPGGSPGASPLPAPAPRDELAEARTRLEKFCEDAGLSGLDTDVRVSANIARAIAQYAADHGADLIAMASHGRTGLRRLMLGSVTEEVLHRSHVPVLCVPPTADQNA